MTLFQWQDKWTTGVVRGAQRVYGCLTSPAQAKGITMSECMVHQLTFGPVGLVDVDLDIHLLSGKPADVADMVCPGCGLKLFVYYRIVPAIPQLQEPKEET